MRASGKWMHVVRIATMRFLRIHRRKLGLWHEREFSIARRVEMGALTLIAVAAFASSLRELRSAMS